MDKIKDLLLLAFWGTLYFLRCVVEIPYLWIKDWLKK
jgi:hypothetical protein